MTAIRKYAVQLVLLLAGASLGAIIAGSVAHFMQLKSGLVELRNYSNHLLKVGTTLAEETDAATFAVLNANLPFCSDEELALMRQFVFNATHVKDMGRTRDGKLYCTTGIGRIPTPLPLPTPDISTAYANFTALAPLVIAPGTKGFLVEGQGVSIVLNPETYNVLDNPPMFYTGLLYDRVKQRTIQAFGHPVPISSAEIAAQRTIERNGVFYQPLCSSTFVLCVVASESRAAMLNQDSGHFLAFVIGGSLLGASFALTLLLFYHRQRSFERRLRRAIRNGDLTVAYQPIVNIGTRAIVGAEALVRWTNESNEAVPPDQFVAVAEEKGFVGEITQLVMLRVVEELGDLLKRDNFRVTINITAQDLVDPRFFALLDRCMTNAKIRPVTIGLELTERSTADPATATPAIARLKSIGHKVYIDDFGSGYSSLSYLHNLAADAIKIDRTFTRTIGTQAVTASVVPQILDIAHQLDLMVVVEGIETEEQAAFFRHAGNGILGQGWLFGKPVPAAQFKKLFHSSAA